MSIAKDIDLLAVSESNDTQFSNVNNSDRISTNTLTFFMKMNENIARSKLFRRKARNVRYIDYEHDLITNLMI